jgi:DNA polymerase III, alpha subunit
MKRKAAFVLSGCILAIVFVSIAFPYPVTIQNALTLKPEPGFDIVSSVWRVIFEPFLGLLLYFNRAFYAIEEFTAVLYWIITVFVVATIVRSFKFKSDIKRFFISQVFNLLILVGVWFALFVFMIFIPLPNDRMVNKTSDWVLVTTHTHTEFSHDGLISEEGLVKWHQRNGFDAFFITDHSNHGATLKFVNARKGKELAGEPVVFCGEEFSGTNHMSLLGLKTDFVTRRQSDSAVIAMARADGAAILVNHWFDGEHKTLEYYKNIGVDGFEIENTATDKRYNREVYQRIRTFCESNKLIMNGGLDFHGYGSACTLWNAFNIPGWKSLSFDEKQEAIVGIIKARDQSKLKVLLLNDRPYYDKKGLFLSTPTTLFNYFRTLGLFQVLSWVCWIFLFAFVRYLSAKSTKKYSCQQAVAMLSVLASLFLISLGLVYFGRIQHMAEFTKMYPEYGRLLLLTGFPFLVFSGILTYFRIFKRYDKL